MNYLCHNGKITSAHDPIITADNRGFRYGDGIFETMRCIDDTIPLVSYHFDRLYKGLKTLYFDICRSYTSTYFIKQIIELCKKNKHNPARVRLMMYRGEGGVNDPQNHIPNYIIQSWVLPNKQWQLNENGLVIGLCKEVKKSCDILANCKTNNYLPYLYAAHYAKQQQWNDSIILNTNNRICDTTIANIFIIKNDQIYTPPLSEGCIEGVMRRYIIENLSSLFSITEKLLTIQDIEQADEIFLTNAIRGIQWVKSFNSKIYKNSIIKVISKYLSKI